MVEQEKDREEGMQEADPDAEKEETAKAIEKDVETADEAAKPKSDGETLEQDAGEQDAGEEAAEEAPEAEKGEAEGANPKSWAEKRAEKKQAKQDKKNDSYKEQIAQLEDKVKRQLAEFENFRNRTEKEKTAMFEIGAKSVIEKMLPVVDNFERGLATVPEEKREDPFVDGMNRIYKQLLTELENLGVKPIETVGKEFDPNLHNAVMQVESEEYESGIVAQELQKGYTYRDSVVRHSMVAVVS